MAFLTPNKTYMANGVTVKQRIIPFGVKCTKDIYENGILALPKGSRYKADTYLKTLNHKPEYITIHNTDDIKQANGTTKSEQYSRATYPNMNMGTTRVHYYVCPVEIWQNLLDTEIGWHVSYSKNATANDKSIAIEIIGNYAQAEDNGARLTAYLLKKYGLTIDKVRTHNSWSGKNCPCWILPHWNDFLAKVQKYMGTVNNSPSPAPSVSVKTTSVRYIMKSLGTAAIRKEPRKTSTLIKRVAKGKYYPVDATVVNENKEIWLKHTGTNTYSANKDGEYLFTKVDTYTIKTTTDDLNVRSSPTTSASKITMLSKGTKVYVFDNYTAKANGFTWVKILVGNDVGYVASKYLK